MALTTVSSDRLSTNVKNTNFTAAEKQDLTDDILPLAGQLGNRNLVHNGAFLVAQRGTSSTSNAYATVDRWRGDNSGTDESPTQAQVDVASGTTPYTLGFRKAFSITNGNQTSGAGTNDQVSMTHYIEGQDIANSGWNYTSASSFITLSFWVKSSVAQNFYGYFRSNNGASQLYPFETGSLSANTWTKITKTIPGNSNLTYNNDNSSSASIFLSAYRGTDQTGSITLNQWGAYNSSIRAPDYTSTWYTTNDATFEITGVQLEVGSVATDFEHRSFAQELTLCQRYYQQLEGAARSFNELFFGSFNTGTELVVTRLLPVVMRGAPSVTVSSTMTDFDIEPFDQAPSGVGLRHSTIKEICLNVTSPTSRTVGFYAVLSSHATGALITISADL